MLEMIISVKASLLKKKKFLADICEEEKRRKKGFIKGF